MKTFTGRLALITGAAHGIGNALARALAEEGARLALVDVRAEALEAAAAPLRARGVDLSTHALDVRDAEAWGALAAALHQTRGGVQLLINNAGVTAAASFLETTPEDFDWVMDVNVRGVVLGTRAFLPQLLEAEEGWIVNVSSLFGLVGVPLQVAYCTSKYAVRGFSEALAQELRRTKVGLTVVHPSGVATNIIRHARMEEGRARDRLVRFFDEKTLAPERAAQIILDGVRRGRRRVLVGKDTRALDWMVRLAPERGMDMAASSIAKGTGIERELKPR